MDKEILRQYSEGLICLSGCFGSELARAFRDGNPEHAEEVAREYQDVFGADNYFLEIMHHPGVEGLERIKKEIVALSKKLDIPLVATQDSHYLEPEDQKAHETLLAVQTNADLSNRDRFSMSSDDYSFIDAKTALAYFKDAPEAVENTVKVAGMCNVELDLGQWVFPDFRIPRGATHDRELKEAAYRGLDWRDLEETPEVVDRIEYELDVIKQKGYAPYFLVVADLLSFAREHSILTNTRGSAAGSLVSYLIGITTVNPLRFRISFERFLNPERPSPPDIDMDFADNRRDEVIEYAKQKYGRESVAQIGTFGTMLARGAVRDVARALGHEYAVGDKIASMIPLGSQGFPMTIDKAMELEPELAALYKNDAATREIANLAKKLEGCVRHISVHAAGVVIAPANVWDFVPTQFDPKGGKVITQYDMYAVEDAGLLKFDFLGIRNLSILEDAVRLVKEHRARDVDLEHIPLDDKKTYEILARGETMGLFQLNGAGMTRYLKELRPTNIEDINIMVALYRPGPMAFIPDYIERKRNPRTVKYLDPRLKDILEPTFGILIYQDDILRIATELAGYTWGEADKFRKAVGKKIPEEMASQEEKFISGCVDNGMTPPHAHELWKMIETFAAYGFNKAHAASYGMVAYQTAYMKANYPAEYMTAVLTADSGDTEKIAEIIAECTRMDIPVLPPDVNESYGGFTVVNAKHKGGRNRDPNASHRREDPKSGGRNGRDQIRFGLYTIKNLGTDIADAIIEERKNGGKFSSFADFLERIKHRNLNKKSLEALIKSGAMDALGERGAMIANMEDALSYNREQANGPANQGSLFEGIARGAEPVLRLKETAPATAREKLSWEKELLGLYISGHPLDEHKDALARSSMPIGKIKQFREGMVVVAAGIIAESRTIYTKNNTRMAFIKIADYNDTIEAVAFPRIFSDCRHLIEQNEHCIKVKGRISERGGGKSIVIEAIKKL